MRPYSLRLKTATIEDADLLLYLRNDPEARRASRNESVITQCEHTHWLKRRLGLRNPDIWIAFYISTPVGVVRRDSIKEELVELSWNVAPDQRGQGFGKEMVSIIAAVTSGRVGAWLKRWNLSSAKIAEYIGMKKQFVENEMEYWERAD